MTANKQKRIRADIWTSLHPIIEAEVERSGLSAQEVINIALSDYFGLSPKNKRLSIPQPESTAKAISKKQESVEETDDYI